MNRLLAVLFLLAAGYSELRADGGRLRVVTTILPVYCIAINIGGELADVRYLVGAGGDAHDYQLTPRDRSEIDKAQLIFMNGLGVEPWLKRVVASANRSSKVVELSNGLGPRLIPIEDGHGHEHERGDHGHDHGEMNAHVWLDPVLMCHMVTNALRAFQQADPPNSSRYASSAADYVRRLMALDLLLEKELQSLRDTAVVTYHDAFPYFARRYGFKVIGVIEEIPDVDPTPRHMARLADSIRSQNVKAIFVEPRHSRRLASRLGRDLGVKVGTLNTLETGPASPTAYEDGMKEILRSLQVTLR